MGQLICGHLVLVSQQLVATNVSSIIVDVKINILVGFQLLGGDWRHVVHDPWNQNVALLVQQRVHQVNQVSHGLVAAEFNSNFLSI